MRASTGIGAAMVLLGALSTHGAVGWSPTIVVRTEAGEALPGATIGIVCHDGTVRTGTVDASAGWTADGLARCDPKVVVAWKDAFAPVCLFEPMAGDGGTIDVPLSRAASVIVSVLGEDGRPVPSCDLAFEQNAATRACPPAEVKGARPRVRHTTDGRWEITGLGSSAGRIRATIEGTALGFSRPLQALRGHHADAGTITLHPVIRLRGQVVRAEKGAPGVHISVRGESSEEEQTVTTDDGSFAFDLPDNLPRKIVIGALPGPVVALDARPSAFSGRVELPAGAVLEGRVSDSDGKPVTGAILEASIVRRDESTAVPPAVRGTTGPNGGFALDGLAAGTWGLIVSHPRYSPSAIRSIELAPGNRTSVSVVLSGTQTISGRVVADGNPVAGAEVRLKTTAPTGPSSRTGDDGRFVLRGLTLSPVTLEAEHAEGWGMGRGTPGGGPVEIVLKPVGDIEGKLLGPEGEPLPDRPVRLAPAGRTTRTGRDGEFAFGRLPAGGYRVSAEVTRIGDDASVRVADVRVEPGEVANVVLGGGAVIDGRFTIQETPARRARVALTHMRRGRPDGNSETGVVQTRADSDGAFRFEGVPDGWFVLRGEFEGLEAARTVRVEEGKARQIDLVVRGEEIEGTIADAASGVTIAGAQIDVYDPQRTDPPLRQRVPAGPDQSVESLQLTGSLLGGLSDDRGRFRLIVPEGTFRLMGSAQGYRSVTRELRVARGKNPRLELTLGRAVALRGVVTDPFGVPVSAVAVAAACASGSARHLTVSDESGAFIFEEVDAGRCLVVAALPDATAAIETEAAAEASEVTLQLNAPSTLTLRRRPGESHGPCPPLTTSSGLPLDPLLRYLGVAADREATANADAATCTWPLVPAGRWAIRSSENDLHAIHELAPGESATIDESPPLAR